MARKKATTKKKAGPVAKEKYCDVVMPAQATKFLKLGWPVKDACEAMGISYRSWARWKKEKPEFRQAVIKGEREFATEKIERNLIDRCLGYDYEEEHSETIEDQVVTKTGDVVDTSKTRKTVKKIHCPPDVSAMRLYLQSRMPEIYGNKVDITSGGKQLIRDDIINLTPAERAKRLREMLQMSAVIGGEEDTE